MVSQILDIIIVGAGPVGNWLAGNLAHAGKRVMVLEVKPAAGVGVCCTGIVSAECYERFIRQTEIRMRVAGSARLVSPEAGEIRVSKEPAPACIIDRPAFDAALAAQAMAAGAEFNFNCRVTNITESADYCSVNYLDKQGGHEQQSRAVVLACGYSSSLPRQMNFGQIRDNRAGAQADVECASDEVEVYFDPDLFPGGFGWLVPTWDGRGLVGAVTVRQAGAALDIFLRRLKTQSKVGLKLSETRNKALPLHSLPRTVGRRVLVVGEAAGQVKATTFGGIYTGLLAAEAAAAALVKALAQEPWKPGQLADYEKAWRGRMLSDLELGWHGRRVYDALSAGQVDKVFSLVKSTGLDRQLLDSQDFSFDWHGALLGRLLSHPRLMAGLISIDTVGVLPDLVALARTRKVNR